MDQERQGIQSTKSSHYQHDCFSPTKSNKPTNDIIATIVDLKKAHTAYFDLMGAFPYISSRGNQYILLLYDYDNNAITVKAMKTCQGAEITRTWMDLHQIFSTRGIAPDTYVMDNEASHELKRALLKYNVKFQLTPPNMHRINATEGPYLRLKATFWLD